MSALPLDGLRVLDLSRLLPGGFCSLLLADLGAEVIKVEDAAMGDYARWAPPYYEGCDQTARSAFFLALNRGKRSIRVNLKTDGGRDVLVALARDADVLLESFRPGVLNRLGVGYERLRSVNSGLVYCAITGYGQEGPARDRPGHDLNYLALNGLLALSGEADGPPAQSAAQIADLGGGALMAIVGIMAALHERERSGEGQFVDVSMFDGSLSWLSHVAAAAFATGSAPRRGHLPLGGGLVCYRPYRCADGYVALGALEPKFWSAFCRGVGREDLLDRAFDVPGSDTHRSLCAIFATRTRGQWQAFASEHDCCLEPVLELDEVLKSDLVASRSMITELEQPGAPSLVKLLGTPVKLSRTPPDPNRAPAPALGEHTDEILRAARFSSDEICALRSSGAVAGPVEAVRGTFLAPPQSDHMDR